MVSVAVRLADGSGKDRTGPLHDLSAMAKKGNDNTRGSGEEVSRESAPKRGKAKSGKGGKGGRVKSRKQAIAIALSKARKKGKRVPRKKK
jgi:Family of unknown function (DUF6496)